MKNLHAETSQDTGKPALRCPAGCGVHEWLTIDSVLEVQRLLQRLNCLPPDGAVEEMCIAGEGNMNLTLRVQTSSGSFIVKQARPWVEKYPQIAAPVDRVLHEIRFYVAVTDYPEVRHCLPALVGAAPEQYVLVLQDLGPANDCTRMYNQQSESRLTEAQLLELVDWLVALHGICGIETKAAEFANRELRELNFQHMFILPFQTPAVVDLDQITPGLASLANEVRSDDAVVDRCRWLGQQYLSDCQTLLHGDFFPGSWLLTGTGVRIIDPEFCFLGRREFDIAVMIAHCRLMGVPDAVIARLLQQYQAAASSIDVGLANQWAAVEILRRLLGVAQLPFPASLSLKTQHVEWALHQLQN
ncbi:MAG: phosphotransferase [Planctomyces sp.]|nr:phosphotransferase [Planctomyces sp.]